MTSESSRFFFELNRNSGWHIALAELMMEEERGRLEALVNPALTSDAAASHRIASELMVIRELSSLFKHYAEQYRLEE